MKKLVFLVLAIGLIEMACEKLTETDAQKLYPQKFMPLSLDWEWAEIATEFDNDSYCVISNYKLEGDTIINDLRYTKVYLNNNSYGVAIRESENKIYAYSYYYGAEKLIYDFNWETSRTMYHECFRYDDYCEADTIYEWYLDITTLDSVLLLDGNYYKAIRANNYNRDIIIVQGIGYFNGLFSQMYHFIPIVGCRINELLCFSKNGKLLYQNEKYANCYSCDKSNQ